MSSISAFGWFHTAISLAPVGLGLWAFARDGKIDLRTWLGKAYFGTTMIGGVTAFGFSKHGFTPGHVLSLITVGLLLASMVAVENWFGRASKYVETLSLSSTYLLLWVFTTTETLTRLPADKPFAANQDDVALLPVRLALLSLFVLGVGYQLWQLRSAGEASAVWNGTEGNAVAQHAR